MVWLITMHLTNVHSLLGSHLKYIFVYHTKPTTNSFIYSYKLLEVVRSLIAIIATLNMAITNNDYQ